MLSDHEQRALEELERCFGAEAGEAAGSRPMRRPPGLRAVAVLACPLVVLLLMGAVVATFALATAAGIGLLAWWLWAVPAHGGETGTATEWGTGRRARGSAGGRAGDQVRRFLQWLSEAP